jgi:hypothetical protein
MNIKKQTKQNIIQMYNMKLTEYNSIQFYKFI